MCLAIPGKIIEVDEEGNCIVDYEAEKREARILCEGFGVGDLLTVPLVTCGF